MMVRHDDCSANNELNTESAESAAKQAADLPTLLDEALGLVPGCRTRSAAELAAFSSVLGRIVPHLPDSVERATLERAHGAFSAATVDVSLAGGLLERAAATLARLQRGSGTMRVAPTAIRGPSHEPRPASPELTHDAAPPPVRLEFLPSITKDRPSP
jgi:hypothetical protein